MQTLPVKFIMLAIVGGIALFSCSTQNEIAKVSAQSEAADVIYSSGPIVTVDAVNPTAEAVAIRDRLIVAVGTVDEIDKYRGNATVDIDLLGRTLAPGFIDGHAHFAQFGTQAIGANLLASPDGHVETIDDLVAQLKEFAEGPNVARTGWVFGTGYDDSIIEEGRHPTRDDLDRVSTDLPVIAVHISGHFSAMNSKGLELVGYDETSQDPPGGIIRRRPGTAEPNGVLEELASIPIMFKALTPKTAEDGRYFLERGMELAKSFGYTTAQEGRAVGTTHQLLANYAENIGFDIDVVSYIDYSDTAPLESKWYSREYRGGYRVGGLKITLDGSPQGRTAWRTQPYLLPPDGQNTDYRGYPAIPDDQTVIDVVDTAHANNWQVLAHANGDAAVDQLLKAMLAAQEKHGSAGRRNTLVHGQYVRPDQLVSMAKLDMTASLFPLHTFYWGDWHSEIIGDNLAQSISPTRTALDLGLRVTSHSDAPVALPNLMQVMWATVNRTSRSGKVIGKDERLTPEEALKAITLWAAHQHFEEDVKGSIEVGKLADFVILSDNPLSIAPERINEIVVEETIKAGRTVWRRQ